MNKILAIIPLALISCQQLNWAEVPGTLNTVVNGVPDIKITKNYYDESSYSFIKVTSGRYVNFTAILSSTDEENYRWVNSEGHVIYSKQGKIVKVSAQPENSFYFISPKFKINSNIKDSLFEELIYFESPDAMMQQTSELRFIESEVITYLDKEVSVNVYEEKFTTEIFNWKGSNKYWVEKDSDLVIRSEQNIYPFRKTYKIEYFYKFKN